MQKQNSRRFVQIVNCVFLVATAAASTLTLACAQTGDSPSVSPSPPFREVAGIKLLMNSTVDPQSDILWDSVGTILTVDGEQEIRPQTDEEWTAVRNAAVVLAESGNLLMMERRAMDTGKWMDFSGSLIDSSEEALEAADARDPEALFEAGGHIYEACLACHETYIQSDDYAAPEGPVVVTSTADETGSEAPGAGSGG
jgi:hypothetical protein